MIPKNATKDAHTKRCHHNKQNKQPDLRYGWFSYIQRCYILSLQFYVDYLWRVFECFWTPLHKKHLLVESWHCRTISGAHCVHSFQAPSSNQLKWHVSYFMTHSARCWSEWIGCSSAWTTWRMHAKLHTTNIKLAIMLKYFCKLQSNSIYEEGRVSVFQKSFISIAMEIQNWWNKIYANLSVKVRGP